MSRLPPWLSTAFEDGRCSTNLMCIFICAILRQFTPVCAMTNPCASTSASAVIQSSPIFRIPYEIIYEILSLHNDNSATLAACSLTCRAWVAISQSLLLSQVRLRWTTTLTTTYNGFFQILDTSPHIGTYVHVLHISWGNDSGSGEISTTISCLGSRLANVQLLRLESLSILPDNLGPSLAIAFPALRILELRDSSKNAIAHMIDMAIANPRLESLSLGVFFGKASRRVERIVGTDVRDECRLREVHCASDHLHALSELASLGTTTLNVRSLYVAFRRQRNFIELGNTLMMLDALECLTLSDDSWTMSVQDPWHEFSLAQNTRLRTLTLSGLMLWKYSHSQPSTLFAFLSCVVSSSLEEIKIYIISDKVSFLAKVDWALFSRILNGPAFSKLRNVTFCLSGKVCDDIGNARRAMEDWLPDLRDRELLAVNSA